MKRTVLHRIRRLFAPQSLRYQLLSRSLLILSGLLVLIGAFQYIFMSDFLYRNTATAIRAEIRSIPLNFWRRSDQSTPSGDLGQGGVQVGLHPFWPVSTPGATVAFIDNTGTFYDLSATYEHAPIPRLPEADYDAIYTASTRPADYYVVKDSQGVADLVVLEPVGRQHSIIGLVQVSTPLGRLTAVLFEQLTIFLVLALCALIAGLLAFLPVLRRTLVPLSRMVQTVGRINAGNLDERLSMKHTQTEVALLSASFNAMLERLEVSFEAERDAKEKMRQFAADASHELRTPLTSIHGFLEVLLRGAAHNPEQLQNALQSMHAESGRLTKLVADLLLLARLDREPAVDMREGHLDGVLRDLEPQLRLIAGKRNVTFTVNENVPARFDPDRMKQVIINLFQNAVQHTDPVEGEICVSLTEKDDGIDLYVRDNGPGVDPANVGRLFERFYRADSARSRKNGGAGLGLAISRSIVERHGGTIRCESEPGKGALFVVWLPKL